MRTEYRIYWQDKSWHFTKKKNSEYIIPPMLAEDMRRWLTEEDCGFDEYYSFDTLEEAKIALEKYKPCFNEVATQSGYCLDFEHYILEKTTINDEGEIEESEQIFDNLVDYEGYKKES